VPPADTGWIRVVGLAPNCGSEGRVPKQKPRRLAGLRGSSVFVEYESPAHGEPACARPSILLK